MTAQLPLALRYPPDQRFDTFVGAGDAIAQLRALAEGVGSDDKPASSEPALSKAAFFKPAFSKPAFSKLYLAGAGGVGKTHLLLAACAHADAVGRRAAYLPLATASGRLRDALEALDGYDLLALDGLDAVAGARDDEIALFDAHNRIHDAGGAIVYAARAMPDALALSLPDLRSRLAQCTRVVLQALDDEGRGEVLRLRAARHGLQLEDGALDWLLRRVDRDLASLTALLDEIDRASLAAQRRITVPFLRQMLGID